MTVESVVYAVSGYVASSTVLYTLGHPKRLWTLNALGKNRKVFLKGRIPQMIAHSVQLVNFGLHAALPQVPFSMFATRSQSARTLYERSVQEAFDPKAHHLITTGSPHGRAFYPRNFAWFYPTLLDEASVVGVSDLTSRITLMENSLRLYLKALHADMCVTTLIPITGKHIVGVNYFAQPSDTLLGVLAGLQQLIGASSDTEQYQAVMTDARDRGVRLLSEHKQILKEQLQELAASLEHVTVGGQEYLVCDWSRSRSSATDTRMDRGRFVTNANVWSTFSLAKRLGLLEEAEIEALLGRPLTAYKSELLALFGAQGYIVDSLISRYAKAAPEYQVTLDFAHTHDGFWDLSSSEEQALFKATADVILNSLAFRSTTGALSIMSVNRPRLKLLHRIFTRAYQSNVIWASFNVEFASRLLAFSREAGAPEYEKSAQAILKEVHSMVEQNGQYYEVCRPDGVRYRTWAYKSAIADSWFPRFASVWYEAFDESL